MTKTKRDEAAETYRRGEGIHAVARLTTPNPVASSNADAGPEDKHWSARTKILFVIGSAIALWIPIVLLIWFLVRHSPL